tara:strand:- start:1514 stop:2176 length:663 start_codon:yes stop_codon:yes gene_type:complete
MSKNFWPRGQKVQPKNQKTCIILQPKNKDHYTPSLYKTELCDTYEEFGKCNYGHNCQFAHGKHELREKPKIVQPSAYKTVRCKHYWGENSICPYGNKCKFVHGEAIGFDLNKVKKTKEHENYRTKECETYNKFGTCPYGDKCAFIHKTKTPDEKKPDEKKPNLNRSISDQENTLMLLENFGLTTDEQKVKDFSVDQLATMNLQETKTGDAERVSRFMKWF